VRFAELVATYERLDATTKRLEMREILADLLRKASARELPEILYLSQGQLRPEYEGVELGVADSLARRAVAQAMGLPDSEVLARGKASGDLGVTAEELRRKRPALDTSDPLEVADVYEGLLGVARSSGEGSQESKVAKIVGLLARADPVETKYLVRFILGTLRLGVREMTILDALAEAYGPESKEARAAIEAAFNLSSDLGLVAGVLARDGLAGLASIRLEVGRPIRPMLAERALNLADVMERMKGTAALEYKYDGLRVQAHVPAEGPARLFSRRLEEIGAQFPELVEALPRALKRRPSIVEGECVPIDPETDEIRPFQEVSRRRGRKHDLDRMQEEVPVTLFLFDVLLDGGEEVADRSFPERRERLKALLTTGERVRLADQRVVRSVEEAQSYFDFVVGEGAEGVMAKSLADGSGYRAGARGFWWIKYKREYTQALADSIDGVVLGAFRGRGRRGGLYGALLMGVYNPELDRFESFCKVGSGFDDAALAELPKRLASYEIEGPGERIATGLNPDVWFRPALVLEVKGAELSLSPIHRAAVGLLRPEAGLALRFPRFTGKWRDDKGPKDATTTQELVDMYRLQIKQVAPESSDPA
jgi:DNA ligase-1